MTAVLIALIALYVLGVAGCTREVSRQFGDTSTALGRTVRSNPALACSIAAVIVGLWPVVLPLAGLFRHRD